MIYNLFWNWLLFFI